MFPKLIVPLRPGIVEITTPYSISWVYTGFGNLHYLDVYVELTTSSIFTSQELQLQLYNFSTSTWIGSTFTPRTITASSTFDLSDTTVISSDPGFYNKIRFILNLGGQSSDPSNEATIPYP